MLGVVFMIGGPLYMSGAFHVVGFLGLLPGVGGDVRIVYLPGGYHTTVIVDGGCFAGRSMIKVSGVGVMGVFVSRLRCFRCCFFKHGWPTTAPRRVY